MAVDLDGTDDYLQTSTAAILNLTGAFSICAWVSPDSVTGIGTIYNEGNTGDDSICTQFLLLITTGKLGIHFRDAVDSEIEFNAELAVTTGVWNHVAVTRSGTAWIFYLNGAAEAETGTLPAGAFTRNNATVGVWKRTGLIHLLNGKVDDPRVFNRALSANEVAALAAGYRGPLGGEVVWLDTDGARAIAHFDGATLSVNTNYLNDKSGSANHGNPTGNPLGYASDAPRLGGIID